MTFEINQLKEVVAVSSELTTWSLAALGGSVAAVVGTSYRRPPKLRHRLPFLFFLPGWYFLGHSVYQGSVLKQKYLAAIMKPDILTTVAGQCNDLFSNQRENLLEALALFGIWLVLFLLGWIFSNSFQNQV